MRFVMIKVDVGQVLVGD